MWRPRPRDRASFSRICGSVFGHGYHPVFGFGLRFPIPFRYRTDVGNGIGVLLAFSFEMLKDFQAFQLAKEFHWGCRGIKVSRFIQDQLFRASATVALNTAEGSGKRTSAEQRRFYGIALGSLRECEAIIELEKRPTYSSWRTDSARSCSLSVAFPRTVTVLKRKRKR